MFAVGLRNPIFTLLPEFGPAAMAMWVDVPCPGEELMTLVSIRTISTQMVLRIMRITEA
jgi:hypothetical protein